MNKVHQFARHIDQTTELDTGGLPTGGWDNTDNFLQWRLNMLKAAKRKLELQKEARRA